MKGGHSRSGPSPDPNALRRDRVPVDWTILPASGRTSGPQAWPLIRPTRRELALWEREWSRPQAVAWEHNRQQIEVAMYVRTLAEAERPDARITLRTLVLRMADSLGLTPSGLRANRWVIVDDEPIATATPRSSAQSAKDRLHVLNEAQDPQ